MSNQLLRLEREQRGWSQARVAEQIGTDPGTISRWERGSTSPSPYFRERLCQLYGKSVQELGLLGEAQSEIVTLEGGISEGEHALSDPATRMLQFENAPIDLGRGQVSIRHRALACLSISLGWLTGLLVLLFYRGNRFVVFYSIQSACFFALAHIITIVAAVTAIPMLGEPSALRIIISTAGSMTALIALVTWIIAMIQAARGKYFRFPIVGGYCERLVGRLATR